MRYYYNNNRKDTLTTMDTIPVTIDNLMESLIDYSAAAEALRPYHTIVGWQMDYENNGIVGFSIICNDFIFHYDNNGRVRRISPVHSI